MSGSIIYYLIIKSIALEMLVFSFAFLIILIARILDLDIFGAPIKKIDLKRNFKAASEKFEPKNITKAYAYVISIALLL